MARLGFELDGRWRSKERLVGWSPDSAVRSTIEGRWLVKRRMFVMDVEDVSGCRFRVEVR